MTRSHAEPSWFSTLFFQSPIAMCVTDFEDGTFVEVNEPFCTLTGYSREELIGRTAVELGFYDNAQERSQLLDHLASHGEIRIQERLHRTTYDEEREGLRYSQRVTFDDRDYVLSQIVDTTDRKRTEASLQQSQQTLQAIFDNARQTFVLLDRERRIVAFNRMAENHSRQLVGHGLIQGDRFDKFIAPEAYRSILASVRTALDGQPTVVQRELTGTDGQVRCYEGHYDPVWGDQGDVQGVFVSVLDVTERKSVEDALRESEIKLRAIFDNSLQSFMLIDRDYRVKMYNHVANERSKEILGHPIREGDPIDHYVRDAFKPDFYHKLAQAFRGESVSHELCIKEDEDAPVWLQAHYSPARDTSGEIIGVFNSLTDISDHKRAQRHMDRRIRELTTVHRVSQRLQSLQSLEELANAVIDILQGTLDYEYCGVFLADDEGRLTPFALDDWQERSQRTTAHGASSGEPSLSADRGIVGWVSRHGESIRCGDISREPRYDPLLPNIQSELCVPLLTEGAVLGVVNVETQQPHAYSESDQRVLEIVASQIAVAIQNAQLFRDAEQARDRVTSLSQQLMQAQEAERRAIANELHDEVGQSLTAIKLLLEADDTSAKKDGSHPVAQAHDLVDDLLDQVRRLSLDLRPAMLDDLGLWPTLKWHVERFEAYTGVQVEASERNVDGQSLPSSVETTAYRIVQEALTNVARHARTDRVQLDLALEAHELQIDIRDRGVGFPLQQIATERASTGLTGMRERAELLGGTLEIASTPGAGTHVTCRLPREGSRQYRHTESGGRS